MILQFKNGTQKKCIAPVEQKVFMQGKPNGWRLSLRITEYTDSQELDTLLENTEELTFLRENQTELFVLKNYRKPCAATVRFSEDENSFFCDLQLLKEEM